MKIWLISIIVFLLIAGCAARQVSEKCDLPRLPDSPERIEIWTPGKNKAPGVHYIDPARLLNEGDIYTTPKGGAAICTPRTWRGAKYVMREWPLWGDAVKKIWSTYRPTETESTPWWKFWR